MSSDRTRLRRKAERGAHDQAAVEAVLDAGFLCHLGVVDDGGWPVVIPTTYARQGDRLIVHGSVASHTLRRAGQPQPVCVTVTHMDGLVVARSVFNHSINYRSVMVFGVPTVLTGDDKLAAMEALVEGISPGQWDYARRPAPKEIAQTSVLALPLNEASTKIRVGPPGDSDGEDGLLDVWAGVIPIRSVAGDPMPDPALRPGIELPAHLRSWHP